MNLETLRRDYPKTSALVTGLLLGGWRAEQSDGPLCLIAPDGRAHVLQPGGRMLWGEWIPDAEQVGGVVADVDLNWIPEIGALVEVRGAWQRVGEAVRLDPGLKKGSRVECVIAAGPGLTLDEAWAQEIARNAAENAAEMD